MSDKPRYLSMKTYSKETKDSPKSKDDTLYGLLAAYKAFTTYFRILINDTNNNLILQVTANPKKWQKPDNEYFKDFRLLKRSEIGTIKLSVKYLNPENLINEFGPILGLKIPEGEVKIINDLNSNGVYTLEINSKYLQEIISTIDKIIDYSPEKKYELIEKTLSKNSA
jgi:hypothetical protein